MYTRFQKKSGHKDPDVESDFEEPEIEPGQLEAKDDASRPVETPKAQELLILPVQLLKPPKLELRAPSLPPIIEIPANTSPTVQEAENILVGKEPPTTKSPNTLPSRIG
ncbi:hypothetical protein EG328_001577 [Venturia inaequalis]|uniref:Uncharacterized protein n=1 Tax=Venturia inaequalis TaxID=5025 RepID=A0A8H3VHG5_VENIN|nr:hypothetical protein EG328_001577 [Venturia inaequalis]